MNIYVLRAEMEEWNIKYIDSVWESKEECLNHIKELSKLDSMKDMDFYIEEIPLNTTIMNKYIYQGKKISHTDFITLCQLNGIMGGRKKSHFQKLKEMAEQGNEKAIKILNALEVI